MHKQRHEPPRPYIGDLCLERSNLDQKIAELLKRRGEVDELIRKDCHREAA